MLVAAASPGAVAACVVASYLLGTFPTAVLVGRRRGIDPTRVGSGNPGATNILRTAGRGAGALTLAGDVAKGALAAGLGWAVGGRGLGVACGVAAVVGPVLPAARRFRGGRGVATAAGMALVLFPGALAVAALGLALAAGGGRTEARGSVGDAGTVPVVAAGHGAAGGEVAALAVCAAVVVGRHRANIARLVRGGEARRSGPPDRCAGPHGVDTQ